MKFIVKENRTENNKTVEALTEINIHSALARGIVHKVFEEHPDAASYDELRLADGRMIITAREKSGKIIVQYKQIDL